MGVVDQSGEFVQLSGVENFIIGKYDYENPKYRDERVVYCGFFVGHWGHFLTEVIRRLWYFLENDNLSDKYIFFVRSEQNFTLEGNYREFFKLLGVLDRIEIINEPVQYKEVVVPQLSCSHKEYYSKFYKKIFSTIIANAMLECKEQPYCDKVYFSRSRWGKAEFGLDMMDDFFAKNGFQIIYPETLTLTQMIFIIQKADTLAAVSGTAAHNILFGKDGQELIINDLQRQNEELFREAYIDSLRDIKNDEFDLSYMIEKIEVTIMIAACNFEEFLRDCIQEILLQTIDNIEIFVVDERTADDSFDIVKMIEKLQKENNRLVHVRDIDVGHEYMGISLTTGKYIVVFEPHDESKSDIVEKLYGTSLKYDAHIMDVVYDDLPIHYGKDENTVLQININNHFLFKVFIQEFADQQEKI